MATRWATRWAWGPNSTAHGAGLSPTPARLKCQRNDSSSFLSSHNELVRSWTQIHQCYHLSNEPPLDTNTGRTCALSGPRRYGKVRLKRNRTSFSKIYTAIFHVTNLVDSLAWLLSAQHVNEKIKPDFFLFLEKFKVFRNKLI